MSNDGMSDGFGLADDPMLWQVLDNLSLPRLDPDGSYHQWNFDGSGMSRQVSASVVSEGVHAVEHHQDDGGRGKGKGKGKGKGREPQSEAELLQVLEKELEVLGVAGKGEEGRKLRNKIAQQRHRMRKRLEVEGLQAGFMERDAALEKERRENQLLREKNAQLAEELERLRGSSSSGGGGVPTRKRPADASAAVRSQALKEEPHDWAPSAAAVASAPHPQTVAGSGAHPEFEAQFCNYQALVTEAARLVESGADDRAGGPLDLITKDILLTSRKLCPMLGQTDPLVMSRGDIAEDFKPVFRVCARAGHLSLTPAEIQAQWLQIVKVKLGLTRDQIGKLLAEREKLIAALGVLYQARKAVTQSLAVSLASSPIPALDQPPPEGTPSANAAANAAVNAALADQGLVNSLAALKASIATEGELRVAFADSVYALLTPKQRLTIFMGPHPSVPSILVVVNMVSTYKDEILASAK
jgi:hypothetical protein